MHVEFPNGIEVISESSSRSGELASEVLRVLIQERAPTKEYTPSDQSGDPCAVRAVSETLPRTERQLEMAIPVVPESIIRTHKVRKMYTWSSGGEVLQAGDAS